MRNKFLYNLNPAPSEIDVSIHMICNKPFHIIPMKELKHTRQKNINK